MKWSTWSALAISAIAVPSVGAWEMVWRDGNSSQHVESGHGPSPCITVNHKKGQLFAIDAQEEKGINMILYGTPDCSGKSVGMATDYFSKRSSVDIEGFRVVSLSTASNSTTTAHSTVTIPPQTSSAGDNAPSDTASPTTSATNASRTTSSASSTTSNTGTTTPNASSRLHLSSDVMMGLVGFLGLTSVGLLG
ncbi:hypothetical protein BDV25DRAFT_160944 [Aspergillus avenaceus]|uniref:Uncharacterized protein n=1 Tax=Aspergillus avenaceus TaxID=36643 RepID=A0A5N6TLE7_ASPAV|nr:hypothetical protein BDV25DRAFT_160944 [Aspergillus avenaceus]